MSQYGVKVGGHPTAFPSFDPDPDELLEEQDFQRLIHLHCPHRFDQFMEFHNRVIDRVVQELQDHYHPLVRTAA